MSYNPSLKLYYYDNAMTDEHRFIPMPTISIEPEPLYANDTLIGYNYNITLDGYATALNLNTYTSGQALHFADTVEAVQHVRDIFNKNNKTLRAVDDKGDIIVASGGLLQSLTFSESENNWFNYARYTAQISFENLFLGDCESIPFFNCNTLPSGLNTANSPYLMDMKKYKVKSVQDSWTIDASNIYSSDSGIGLYNEYLDISYNVQAVGKYIVVSGNSRPAWEQAKSYCINRIHQEINRLNDIQIGKVTSVNQNSTCSITTTANNISSNELQSLLYQLPSGDYTIYNETISCEPSESEGSFSLTYKSILKRSPTNDPLFGNTHCIHKITKNRSVSDDGTKKDVRIVVNGEIEGLVQGGLFANPEQLRIPNSGTLLSLGSSSGTKYANALAAYNQISTQTTSRGTPTRELSSVLVRDRLEITNGELSSTVTNPNDKPKKLSHTVSHNFSAGTISYSEEYSSENMSAQSGATVTRATITKTDPINHIAEFIIPGRSGGPIIQKFVGKTSKKISIAIDGTLPSGNCCDFFSNACTGIAIPQGVPGTGLAGYDITENRYNFNSSDGSFTINRSYIKIG